MPRGSIKESITHDKHKESMSGHFHLNKTLDLVERFYYWPKMQRGVRRYVEQCGICQKDKGTSSNVGLSRPLPIPNRPWECIGMDFIVVLPRKKIGLDSVFIVVDRLSEMGHFIPYKTTHDTSHIAHLFFKEIVRIHGLPTIIVVDRDVKFMGHF